MAVNVSKSILILIRTHSEITLSHVFLLTSYKLLRLQGFLVIPPSPVVWPLMAHVSRIHLSRTE